MRSDFEKGPLYPFCVIPVGDPTRFRVENLRTGERFGIHDQIINATDEAQERADALREGNN